MTLEDTPPITWGVPKASWGFPHKFAKNRPKKVHPQKLTWHWKTNHLKNVKFLLKMVIFQVVIHVSFLGCTPQISKSNINHHSAWMLQEVQSFLKVCDAWRCTRFLNALNLQWWPSMLNSLLVCLTKDTNLVIICLGKSSEFSKLNQCPILEPHYESHTPRTHPGIYNLGMTSICQMNFLAFFPRTRILNPAPLLSLVWVDFVTQIWKLQKPNIPSHLQLPGIQPSRQGNVHLLPWWEHSIRLQAMVPCHATLRGGFHQIQFGDTWICCKDPGVEQRLEDIWHKVRVPCFMQQKSQLLKVSILPGWIRSVV